MFPQNGVSDNYAWVRALSKVTRWSRAAKTTERLWKAFSPEASDVAGRIIKAGAGDVSDSGRAYNLANELLGLAAGQRIIEVDVKQALGFKASKFSRDIRDASSLFPRECPSKGTRSPEQIADAIERFLPSSHTGHVKWRTIEGKKYYMPGEVCDPIGREWFFTEEDQPLSDEELLGMYLVSISRGTNLLLDVGPDKHGLIPQKYVGALQRLRANLDRLNVR